MDQITIRINGEDINLPPRQDLPVSLTYEIEDEDDFRQKKSGTALNITVPATVKNSQIFNSFDNPGIEDTTPDVLSKPLEVCITSAGHELMMGKAFITAGRKQFGKPLNYDIDVFGDNADWVIENKELTLFDVLSTQTHVLDKTTIENSWSHDGTVETRDFVYAPVRYRAPFGMDGDAPDSVARVINMKPSLFLYWLLYRGFKKAGYKIQSSFFDTTYFRRMVMPWTWDDFLFIKAEKLRCKASRPAPSLTINGSMPSGYIDSGVTNDFSDGNFDNGVSLAPPVGCYNYDPIGKTMNWIYLSGLTPAVGTITAGFSVRINSSWQINPPFITVTVTVEWYKNAILQSVSTVWVNSSTIITQTGSSNVTLNKVVNDLVVGDVVSAVVRINWGSAGAGTTVDFAEIVFETNYFRAQPGTVIDFKSHTTLQKYKWLDLVRGTIDAFGLQLNTDTKTKTVVIEPAHEYTLDDDFVIKTGVGYYNGKSLDWTEKEDLSQVSETILYQDCEREFSFKMKEDNNDGILKLINDRKKINITEAIYHFPEKFKKGNRSFENRFFSGVVHCMAFWWGKITNIVPQLVCLIPENIANTSNEESQSTLGPKLLYYKGLCDRNTFGGWNWEGDESKDLPYMFAVNYKPGGENDPILTYCDQRIEDGANGAVIGKGLLKRFYWQRLAIMRHGKKYVASFNLNNTDVIAWLHREFKLISGQKYQLIKIESYKPNIDESTRCTLWKWYPIRDVDNQSIYPSKNSVKDGLPNSNTPDFTYQPSVCEAGDIINFQ